MKKMLCLLLLLFPFFVYGKSLTAVDYIEKIASDNNADKTSVEEIGNTGLAYDGTIDNNLRYVGLNPNNYIDIGDRYTKDIYIARYYWIRNNDAFYTFDYFYTLEDCNAANRMNPNNYRKECSLIHKKGDVIYWRIIGVFNDVNINGKKETRLKVVRDEPIGQYSWDYSHEYSPGLNDWGMAALMKLMNPGFDDNKDSFDIYEGGQVVNTEEKLIDNSLYFDNKAGYCVRKDEYYDCDFSGYGLGSLSKKYIEKVNWNVGVADYQKSFEDTENAVDRYNDEHRTEERTMTSYYWNRPHPFEDNAERKSKWNGYVGLIHYSDFLFASKGNGNVTRKMCLNDIGSFGIYSDTFKNVCAINNYLNFPTSESIAILTMDADDNVDFDSVIAYNFRNSYTQSVYHEEMVSPVVYLKDNILVTGGEGTKEKPYSIELIENNSIEIDVTEEENISNLFEDIDLDDVRWEVEDKSIVKIENGTIKPLKVGTTKVLGITSGIRYTINIKVTGSNIINPETKVNISITVSLLFIGSLIYLILMKNKKISD